MTPERWQQIKEIFDEVDPHPPNERSAIIGQLCGEDHELRHQIEQMFEEIDDEFIGNAIVEESASLSAFTEAAAAPPESFGRYRIIRRIGQGGMGAVYEATRVDDFRKKVAIKIIKHEFDSDAARTRFQQERQLLAVLEHPYIARLIDGGESESGSPYLVLEFVDGVPISEYCEKLDRNARLRLVMKVCEAVDYAHRNLIIHRDLKPGNILVTENGEPKLLDFGIAKLIDPSATLTQTSMVALTPEYASPEQVRGEPISTASDVYSLGVVLYQILTGRKPYTLHSVTPREMDLVICQQPPAHPRLGDELDDILMMALRKEPERRYRGVRQFAEDIESYLSHQPVRARPDTTWYRTSKFVRRNWVGLLAASVAVAGLCIGAGVAIYQARIAKQRLDDVRQLSNTLLFDLHKEIANLPGGMKARQILVTTALKYLDGLTPNASGDPAFLKDLGHAYEMVGEIQGMPGGENLGKLDDALVSWGKSLALYRKALPADPSVTTDIAKVMVKGAWSWHFRGGDSRAITEYREAIGMLESYLAKKPGDQDAIAALALAYGDASISYKQNLDFTNAIAAIDKSVEYQNLLPRVDSAADASRKLIDYQMRLVNILAENGDHKRFMTVAHDARGTLETWEKNSPNNLRARMLDLTLQNLISEVYDSEYAPSIGDTPSALEHARLAIAILKEQLARDPANAGARANLAYDLKRLAYLHRESSPELSLNEAREAIAMFDEFIRVSPATTAYREIQASAKSVAGLAFARLKRGQEARAEIGAALQTQRQLLEGSKDSVEQQINSAIALMVGCEVYRILRDWTSALDTCRSAADIAARLDSRGPREVALFYVVGGAYVQYGRTLKEAGHPAEEVQPWFEKDAAIWRDWPNPNDYVELSRRRAAANLASLGKRN